MFKLREWQVEAIERCKELTKSIVEACPGAGKSAFSGGLAKHWLDTDACKHVLAVVPSVNIKRGVMKQWAQNWGMRVRSHLIRKGRMDLKIPRSYDATVITYQELRNEQCEDLLRLWAERQCSFGVIFDEIHHASQSKSWGDRVRVIGHDLASRVCIMTGTPFRTDKQPIELMEYVVCDGGRIANPHYRYVYRQAVEDDVCRAVSVQWMEGAVTLLHEAKGLYEKQLENIADWEINEAKRQFFSPDGEPMRNMVKQVHKDLFRLRSQRGYEDAAALFVCKPAGHKDKRGSEASAKHVHGMAKLIRDVTGVDPIVVTHDDKHSADRIDVFRGSTEPYIVAVNMVSEGVDIPRLRKIAFCRFTPSEMLFRQIAGRVMRKTMDRDPTASQLYVPRFRVMEEFGQRLWDEAEMGLKDRPPVEPCDLLIDDDGDDSLPKSPRLTGVDATGCAGDGMFDQLDVERHWINIAEQVTQAHGTYRHWNTVELGAVLKTANQFFGSNPERVDEAQHRQNLCDRLKRRVSALTRLVYDGHYGAAWNKEVFERYNVQSLDDIRTLWTHDKIESAIRDLERRLHRNEN